jgi:hypothetical protein
MDYGRQQWPQTIGPNWNPLQPIVPNVTTEAEREALKAFRELVKKAEEFDKKADQPHCEDPNKIRLLERVLERLEVIEKKLGIAAN